MKKAKKKEEFDFRSYLEEAIGQFIISIGRGDFKSTVWTYMSSLYQKGYEKGLEEGRKSKS